jgi:hypothetical protein
MSKPRLSQPTVVLPKLYDHSMTIIGQIANQTTSDYLFADYQQRRASRTTQTQLAALVLWVDYLREVGAAATLLASARQWAQGFLTSSEQAYYAEYAAQQQQSLPIIYGALYSQQLPIHYLCSFSCPRQKFTAETQRAQSFFQFFLCVLGVSAVQIQKVQT